MTMRRFAALLAVVLLASIAGGAVAQAAAKRGPFKVTDYPLEVRKTLSVGPVTCRDVEGGGKVELRAGHRAQGRLQRRWPRRLYRQLREHEVRRNSKAAFCGTGGCMVDFLVTLPNGRLRSVFAGQIHGYEILPGRPRKVRFGIFHSYCKDSDPRLLQGPADRVQAVHADALRLEALKSNVACRPSCAAQGGTIAVSFEG